MFQRASDIPNMMRMIDEGYITVRRHSQFPLFIYNYTARAQYTRTWNEATIACRGLITDVYTNILARPFPKFFNLEELDELPNEPFEVYEKLDGSLGILYHWEGKPYIATRGSFNSPQARWATELLHTKYAHAELNPDITYLFEIIYPANRIVVDYGDQQDIVLLAMIDTKTGQEYPLESQATFPCAQRYSAVAGVAALKSLARKNAEGFVVRFQQGLRVKVKLDEYVRLHRILTGISEHHIWEKLRAGDGVDDLLNNVPDEFYTWVRSVVDELNNRYARIEAKAKSLFAEAQEAATTRKELAVVFTKTPFPGILFAMLDGRDYSRMIWKLMEPINKDPYQESERPE